MAKPLADFNNFFMFVKLKYSKFTSEKLDINNTYDLYKLNSINLSVKSKTK